MTDTDPNALSPAEQHVAACTERGERADLSGFPEADRVVRAVFLRALLLGLPLGPEVGGAACVHTGAATEDAWR